ncbi:MAG: signal recognition particle protein [Candidatus Marinimicrobia bacterium]|nr:signal recognition particle protein [Candidatus Neomarinimicrobiota bacterium]|tara:strand:+ start:34377 stop:35696 length:1320 start_codon:yes stop_codon:yes gene_type:complete
MFGQLQNRFKKIFKTIKGQGKISESNISDAIREIRIALLESDVNFKVVSRFIERVKKKSLGSKVFDSVTPGQQFVKLVLDELIDFLKSSNSKINLHSKEKSVLVLSGLQGSGKTTTAVKIAGFLKREFNKKALLVGLDLQRPAAVDQLEILSNDNNIDCYVEKKSKNPLKVLENAQKYAESNSYDALILDTAGRLHIDDDLIKELNEIIDKSNPSEVIYVADGMTGQDAINSSSSFSESCKVTGCIITKMDSDTGGGVALSIKDVTDIPIKFITFGEKISDIEVFNPDRIARRILGLSDIVGLVEEAAKSFNEESIGDIQSKLTNNTFDLNDFKNQIDQMGSFDNLGSMMKMMPGMSKMPNINTGKKQLKRTKAIIDSMTKAERMNPSIINGSRRKRIAIGSGTSMQNVNQLLKQFNQMKVLMKKFSNNKTKFKLPFIK